MSENNVEELFDGNYEFICTNCNCDTWHVVTDDIEDPAEVTLVCATPKCKGWQKILTI